jgi:hypothetical protein
MNLFTEVIAESIEDKNTKCNHSIKLSNSEAGIVISAGYSDSDQVSPRRLKKGSGGP